MALIQVTQNLIKSGRRGDCYSCALANGIRQHLNDVAEVCVKMDTIEFYERTPDGETHIRLTLETPPDCQRFIDAFDRGVAQPFTTSIPIPLSLLRNRLT
jgi:hypothetical protein